MIKLYICCLVLIIGSVEVGPDIVMKFHQEVMEIVSYDIYLHLSSRMFLSWISLTDCQIQMFRICQNLDCYHSYHRNSSFMSRVGIFDSPIHYYKFN